MTNAAGTVTIADPEAMHAFGARVAAQLRAGDVLVLTGELGAGKTTFTRGLGEALGVRGAVTSPTFVLARTHPREAGPPLVHVDAYRLADAAELDDLDLDLAASITVIEWGAGLVEAICDDWLELVIERPVGGAGAADPDADVSEPRTVRFRAVGSRGAELLGAIA
ncbi:tRNA (adenosine(37)-N6)-threonylcarbamoyltransferase complex ATPase subunit type 1 TsaE [Microcella sp.]|uniref:tRNA (adenosine(37)-N6)-threonylcarbamoyltransferase complex ATPase subunit type 1 TsaE n=1 Tax=Microcella sp. TaxID=1913979 RepID=UPI00391A1072